jgi:hypothetical protein
VSKPWTSLFPRGRSDLFFLLDNGWQDGAESTSDQLHLNPKLWCVLSVLRFVYNFLPFSIFSSLFYFSRTERISHQHNPTHMVE